MRKGWELKEFEDCLDKVVYTEKIQRKDFLEDGEFPVISQEQDFINGYWNNSDSVFKIKKPVVIFGDHTQVLKYVDFDFVLGADGVKILQPIDGLKAKYFYYFLNSVNLKSLGYARHYRLLKEIQVPIPPLPEQQRIVSVLDEAFASIAQAKSNAERNLVNARELFESVLDGEFQNAKSKWESKIITELSEIGDGNHGGNYPKKSDMRDSGVPFIRSVNLVNGHIADVDMRFISDKKHNSLKKGHLKTGDVLFTNRGEMGKSAVVDSRYDDANLNSQIAFFRCSEQILPWYLYYILQSPYMQAHSTKSQTGSALQQLPIGIISKFEVPLPPLAEQRAIVGRLEALSAETGRLEEIYQSKVEALEELKKSVLGKAFGGEI